MENKIMAMRVALRDVSRVAEEMTRGTMTGESVDRKTVDAWAMRLCKIISRGLDIPLRQCDVGTVEEQSARFREFCKKDSMDNFKATAYCAYECPCGNKYDCKLAWAQMPYEEGGAK